MACEIEDTKDIPVCSDSLKVLKNNVKIMDQYINSEEFEVPDRLGIPRKTWAGLEEDVQVALANLDPKVEQLIAEKIIAQGGVEIADGFGNSLTKVINQKTISDRFDSIGDISSLEINIPSDYPSIQSAIDGIKSNNINSYSMFVILVDNSHKISERIDINDCNLRNVTITSNGVIETSSDFISNHIFKISNSTSPIIDLLVDAKGRGGIGIDVFNSDILVNEGCGVTNAELSGIRIQGSSRGSINGAIFSNAVQRRVSDPSLADHHGVSVVGSNISAIGADVSGSLYYGIASSQGSSVNFRHGIAKDCYRHAVRASQNSNIDAFNSKVDNCGAYAYYALYNSIIRVGEVKILNAGRAALIAYNNSVIYAEGASIVGGCSLYTLRASSLSKIVFTRGNIENTISGSGVLVADNISDITALSVTIDVIGLNSNVIFGASLSRINLQNATIKSISSISPFSSVRGSGVYLVGATLILDNDKGLSVSFGGTIHARDCTFNGSKISSENINLPDFNNIYGNGIIWS